MSFIVFSDDWGVHPSSCQHIFKVLSRSHRVLWVNTLGMRLPRLSFEDARKVLQKASSMLRTRGGRRHSLEHGSGPAVCSPLMTPFRKPRWIADWNVRSVLKSVRRAASRHGVENPLVVTTVPNVHDVLERMDSGKVVYYCVDDFSEWPGLDKSAILGMEKRLLEHVDEVICTSQALYERFHGELPTALLTHGVEIDLFSRSSRETHRILEGIPEPRVGYYGLFDARADWDLLVTLAGSLPDVSFVITGPTEGDVSALRRTRNIHFTGPVDYAELPLVVNGWKACLLPYRLNELTRKINPLKLKEYLATGKPVIASPLPEAVSLLPHLRIAGSATEWTACLREALSGAWQPDRQAVLEFLEPHSWERKAEQFLRICEAA